MYRGRYTLGDFVPLSLASRNSSDTPTLPGSAPVADVWSDSAKVLSQKLPIHDRYGTTAFFHHLLQLDSRFSAGRYRVLYRYKVGSDTKLATDTFEIVAGGHHDGPGIAMHYYHDPGNEVVLLQGEGGRLLKLRNPRL